jgi:hypothetical protein
VSNWNVYKIFKSGKRAKSPFETFEASDKEHFFSEILPTLGEKLQKADWLVISAEEPQERPEGGTMSEDDIIAKKRNRYLTKIAIESFPDIADKGVSTCLMMNEQTDWKWAWCVAEGATHRFLGLLSNKFETRREAVKWIETTDTQATE